MDYTYVLQAIHDRTEGLSGANPEYERGQLELAADLFGRPLMDTNDRIEEIRVDLANFALTLQYD